MQTKRLDSDQKETPQDSLPLDEHRDPKKIEEKLQAILKITRTLASDQDSEKILDSILQEITRLMDADRSTLFFLDKEHQEYYSKIIQGFEIVQLRLPIGTGIAGWVAQTGLVANVPNAYEDERFYRHIDEQTGYHTHSVLTMPLKNQMGEVIAIIQVLNKSGQQPFSQFDEDILSAIAAQTARVLENKELYNSLLTTNSTLIRRSNELAKRRDELDILYDIEQEMNRAFDLDEMMYSLLVRVIKLLNCQAGSIALLDEKGMLQFRSVVGEKSENLQPIKIEQGEGFIGWSSLHKQPVICNTPDEDERFRKDIAQSVGVPVQSVLCVPLLSGQESLGAIQVLNKKGRKGFTEDDRKLLSLIASQISRAVKIGRQREEKVKQNRLATIGQLLSGLLHDLKTPMTLISGYAQMLSQPQPEELRKEFAQEIDKQIAKLNQMTREVLAFARGESTLLIRKIHLNKFVSSIKQHLQQEFKNYPIELEVEAKYLGVAYFDEVKIERLIYNLARNARQAMPSGGKFKLLIDKEEKQLLISASDTGHGIPSELQDKIFDSFVTSHPSQGSGLGLAIVKKIVDEHHGSIFFTSKPNSGTTFRVLLPLEPPK